MIQQSRINTRQAQTVGNMTPPVVSPPSSEEEKSDSVINNNQNNLIQQEPVLQQAQNNINNNAPLQIAPEQQNIQAGRLRRRNIVMRVIRNIAAVFSFRRDARIIPDNR